MVDQDSVMYSIRGRMSITPMFGSYLFMPVLHHDQRLGSLNNKSEEIIKNAYYVKNQYDSNLNCFPQDARRNTSRDYVVDMQNMVFNNKLHSVYFAIDPAQTAIDNNVDKQSDVFKSKLNAQFEYQLFMAQ